MWYALEGGYPSGGPDACRTGKGETYAYWNSIMPPGNLLQRIPQDLSSIVDVLEERFLYLIKESAEGAIPPDAVAAELSALSRDLKRCFRRLVEVEERQDLSFKAASEVQEISQRCIWLFRRFVVHQAFLKRLSLEAKLRDLISTEAFGIHQALLSQDEEERKASASADAEIRALMLREEDQTEAPLPDE